MMDEYVKIETRRKENLRRKFGKANWKKRKKLERGKRE